MTDRFSPATPCHLCGGTIGCGSSGAHELCHALARRGRDTPCLGKQCRECSGSGFEDRAKNPRTPSPVFGDPGALERYCAARWPACAACKGSGKREDQ